MVLGPFGAFLPLGLLLGDRPLEPAARLRRESHPSRRPPTGIHRRQTSRASAGYASGHAIPARQSRFLPHARQPCRRPWRLRLPPQFLRHPARRSSGGIRRAQPTCRQDKPLLDEHLPLPRGLSGQDAHLTVLHLPQRPTIVPGHARRVLALFDQPRCIAPQDAIGLPALGCHELLIGPPPLLLIPPGLPAKALQAPDATPRDSQRHWLKGFPGQGAVLPNHVIPALRPSCTPSKTIMEDTLELLSLVHEAFNLTDLHVKGGNHARLTYSATTR